MDNNIGELIFYVVYNSDQEHGLWSPVALGSNIIFDT